MVVVVNHDDGVDGIGGEMMMVAMVLEGNAGDRGYRVKTSEEGSRVNRFNHKMNHDDVTKQGKGAADKRFDIRDTRRYNDVGRGKPSDGKEYRGDDNAKDAAFSSEEKKSSYLVRLPELCGAMGISKVEVKALGGLKVMLVFETVEEIRDVLEHCLQENNNTKKNEEQEDGRMNMDEDRNDDGNMKERNRKMEENGNESGDDEMADKNNLEEGSNGGDGSDFRKAAHGGRELHEDQESRISSEVKEILIQTSDEGSKKRDEMVDPGIVNVNIVNDGPMVDEAHEGVATNTRPVMDKNVVIEIGEQNIDGLSNGFTSQNGKSDIPSSNEPGRQCERGRDIRRRSSEEGEKGRSYNLAKDVARQIDSVYNATDGVKFTGKLSDLYKVSHEEVVDVETGIENRRTRNEDGVHNVCSISENQLRLSLLTTYHNPIF
ncbi:hypothetical protein Tco_0194120 [Tanacetum coccineum]